MAAKPKNKTLLEKTAEIDDDELIAILYRHRAALTARLEGMPSQTRQPTEAAASVSGSSTAKGA
jgi:hypothetical protein